MILLGSEFLPLANDFEFDYSEAESPRIYEQF